MIARIARAAGIRVLAIDYRLGPEHPFPAAVDDTVAVYRWLLSEGFLPHHIAFAGDSAGGGLTVAALVAVREACGSVPAGGVAISPWVDLEALGESMTAKADVELIAQRDSLLRFAQMYLAGTDPRHPLAAPIYADLAGLPPLLIQVGTEETLLDDSIRLAARAKAAGVEVTLEPWEEMFHVWHYFAGMLPEGQQAIEHLASFITLRT